MNRLNLLIIGAIIIYLFTSCSKTSDVKTLPQVNLPGTTWKAFSFVSVISGDSVYELIQFNNNNTATIYYADADGTNVITENTYPCIITQGANESFEIDYSPTKIGTGFTTSNPNQIIYQNITFNRTK